MEQLEKEMADGGKAALREYGEISSAFESMGGYDVDVELARVANGLHIGTDMLETPFNLLSGGERTRINLGRMILMKVGLMLLDEPTNHLDFQSVEWLEEYLRFYKGTALIISHDRYFLDQTVTRIVEIENLTSKVWEGNYSAYLHQKEEWLKAAEAKIRQDERKIEQLEFTVRRLHGMGTEKLHKRAFSMEKRINRIKNEMPTIIREGKNIRASFGNAARSGEDVLTIKSLKKCFGDRCLFSDVSLEIKKDDRIALLGSNGTGKTTLVKILLGEEDYNEGKIRWGAGVKTAYLPQLVHFENERETVLDCIINELGVSPATARNRLGSFHFRGEDVFKLIRELSGGEKSRLKLCILMYNGANMLILDEPTNHLDIRSTEWIEEAIEGFDGTLLLISHDRYFINRFAERVWSLENGGIVDFEGGYEEFREYTAKAAAETENKAPIKPEPKAATNQSIGADQNKKRSRETDAAKKQLAILEREIEKQEQYVAGFDAMIEEVSSDHIRITELMEEKAEAETELDRMVSKWEELMNIIG
jgi:ATPase subunit of ABC transporter with duplicated ATPase domains